MFWAQENRPRVLLLGAVLAGVALSLGGGAIASSIWPDWVWTNIEVHSAVEAVGGCIALVLAALLLLTEMEADRKRYPWIAAGLVGMGILDLGHAGSPGGDAFVWSHSTAVFIGGILFGMMWLPAFISESALRRWITPITAALAVSLLALAIVDPILVPEMTKGSEFTGLAIFLNRVGGMGFLAAGAWFLFSAPSSGGWEGGLFAVLCVFFGLGGFLFDGSSLWDANWWWWHILRLAAYGLVITFATRIYQNTLADRERAEEALQKSEALFRGLVTFSPMGILTYLLKEDRLVLVEANPAATRLTGIDTDQFKGKPIEESPAMRFGTEILERFIAVARSGENWSTEHVETGENGDFKSFELAVFPLMEGMVGVLLQETTRRRVAEIELVERTEALERANDALAARNTELDEFTYVASHDLQEPLRKLTSFCRLLEMDLPGELPERAQTDIHFITDGAKRMQTLIQDLLSLSRAGRAEINREWIPLEKPVERALSALDVRIAETGATITCDPLPKVWGDPTLIAQLYQNLVGNALKFLRDGVRPEVHLSVKQENGVTLLGVRDNGIGIDSRFTQQVFAPFKRLHGRSDYEGTGIGLALCRKTVDRHGGRLWVESEVGSGSHFRFTLEG